MKRVSELKTILGAYFTWNKSRLECFLDALLGLFMVSTVNLRQIALAMEGSPNSESRYRRLKAFFTQFTPCYLQIARWIFSLFVHDQQKVYLTMDRTNWYFGKKKINAFVLAIAHEGVAIPIYWMMLNKAGNSTADEQIQLIKWFIDHFGTENIEGLLADREFANRKFFQWLIKHKIPFYIRIKENTKMSIFKVSKHTTLKKLFHQVNNQHQNYYPFSIWIWGLRLCVAAGRSEKGELLIVVTNGDAKKAVPVYLRRWEIECLFQSLKGRGFNFEETHLTDLNKLSKLIALLAVGTAWAIKVGEWRALIKPISFNQHSDSLRSQYSYFRYGLDFIREALFKAKSKYKEFKQCLKALKLQHYFECKVLT